MFKVPDIVLEEAVRQDIIEWAIKGSPSNWEKCGKNWKAAVKEYWKEHLNE